MSLESWLSNHRQKQPPSCDCYGSGYGCSGVHRVAPRTFVEPPPMPPTPEQRAQMEQLCRDRNAMVTGRTQAPKGVWRDEP